MATTPPPSAKALDDYYGDTLDRFAGWIKHQDSKAAFALVILGIGSSDLLDRADALAAAHTLGSRWGDAATAAFWCAVVVAVLTVAFAWLTVRPRTKRGEETHSSIYFFRSVAEYRSAREYETAVTALSEGQMQQQLAGQVWELARDVNAKLQYARSAYVTVALFLLFWGAARVFLALAS